MINFNDTISSDNNLLIVDALNLSFRFRNHGKSFQPFASKYVDTVKSFAQSFKCGKIIITADKGSSTYRKEIYPDYKLNRKEKFESQSDSEKEEFAKFFTELELALDLCQEAGIPVLRFQGVEADDLSAYIVKKYHLRFDSIYLLSTDRDWLQLLTYSNVTQFSYTTKKEISQHNWDEHFDYPLEHFIHIKALEGDTGDNIYGIPSVGPKRAKDLIAQYETVFDLYEAADSLPDKPAFMKNVKQHKETLMLNIQLVDTIAFCEDAIGVDNLAEVDKLMETF